MRTPLDPSNNSTFDSVQSVFAEVSLLLPEMLLHTGHDEVDAVAVPFSHRKIVTIWSG
jgi:hypothetical protein